MRSLRALRPLVFTLAVLALAWGPWSTARAAEPFYEELLRSGIAARERAQAARAAKLLRLACFGLLEEPPVLARCLAHLALAQAETGETEEFRKTFLRLAEVERRFGGYSKAELAETVRRHFEHRLAELVSPEDLARSGRFGSLVPDNATVEAPLGVDGEQENASSASEPGEPSLSRPLPEDVAAAISRVRALESSGEREVLAEELARLRPLADLYREIPEIQHVVGELAYRLRRWRESRDYFERGGEIDPDQPAVLFYFAVALYETGETERSAEVLRKCLPRLRHDAFIEDYAEKILGPGE